MWIFITDSAGSKQGAPIRTAPRWNSTKRLDKAGTFSFDMPAGDSLASLLASKREAHCYKIINDAVTEVGAGIIDKIETVVGSRPSTLRVSGGDLLRELTYRTVGNLALFDPGAATVTPSSVQHHDPDGSTPNTVMTNAFDDDTNTQTNVTLKSDEYIYIRYTTNTEGAIFDLDAGKVNDNAAVMSPQYFDGGAWQTPAGFSDGTSDGGATLAKDGTMSWTRPSDAETMVHNGVEGYWMRFTPNANLDEVGFKEVDVLGDGPTATALADIMAYAPAGWTVDAVNGYAATENTAYLFFAGENVLEALKILAEHTGEHFYLGAGKKIVWVQDDPVADPTASGYRAVPMYGGMVESNALVCLIQSLNEIEDGYKRCSRVYPHGAGKGTGRVSLANATDSPGTGYTLAASDNYVKHDATDTALRIDKDITWPEIGRIEEDAVHSVHASNQLLASAVEYLSRHYAAQTSYKLTVAGLDGTVAPGETIPLTYWEYRNGSSIIDIDATLIILESQTAIDNAGTRTMALTVATTDTWPETEGRVVADHLRKAKRATGGAGPGGTQGGAGGTGDIHVVTHVKHRGDLDTLIRFLDDQITMDVGGKGAFYVDDTITNVLLGAEAGLSNISGTELVYIGDRAGYTGLTEDSNVAIGADAMRLALSSASVAIGQGALESAGATGAGDYNVAVGSDALGVIDDGHGNVAVGYAAMWNVTEGDHNVAIGDTAMQNGAGSYNIAIGRAPLGNATTAVDGYNIAIGDNALYTTTSGLGNIAIGREAMMYNTTASYNVVIGHQAGVGAAPNTFANSVIVGYQAGSVLRTGSNNVLIGYQSGLALTGGSNVFIGYLAGSQAVGVSNQLYIENSNSATPLIYGEFDNDLVKIHGDLDVTGNITMATTKFIGITGNEIITFQAAGTIDFTGADVTMDNDLTVTNDILLSDGSVIGITGNEIITFNAAGTIAITGATLTLDGDISVANDILLADGSVIGITGNEIITFNAAGTIAFSGADVTMSNDLTVTRDIAAGRNVEVSNYLYILDYDAGGDTTSRVISRDNTTMFYTNGVVIGQFANGATPVIATGDLLLTGGLNVGTGTGAAVDQVAIGTAPSSLLTIGMTINQAGNDDEIIAFQSSDVAHGALSWGDTDTFGSLRKSQDTSGGLRIRGLKSADGVAGHAVSLQAFLAEDVDATKDVTGIGIIHLDATQTSGDALANLVANGNAVVMRCRKDGAWKALWILDEDGDVYIDGTQNVYDEFDDAVMAWDATRVLADRGGEILRYNKEALVKAGVMSPAGWISQRGTTKLLMGAVGQLWQQDQAADAEREVIKVEIAALQEKLDLIERRG